MVKRHYVITAGAKVGVFFDHWIPLAHLVNHNKSDCVWQRADSEEQAEELFQEAKRAGRVRIVPNGQQKFSFGSQTSSVVNAPSPSSSNSQLWKNSSAPRVAVSHSKSHLQHDVSQISAQGLPPSWGQINSDASYRSHRMGHNAIKPLARTCSEPMQDERLRSMHSADLAYASPMAYSDQSRVDAHISIRIPRVESPSWLASYPDEEESLDSFPTPPLSPITSPVISSKLVGLNKSEPASTLNLKIAGSATSDDGSGHPKRNEGTPGFRSPKPFAFEFQMEGGLRFRADENEDNNDLYRGLGHKLFGTLTPRSTRKLDHDESFFELLHKHEETVNRLRTDGMPSKTRALKDHNIPSPSSGAERRFSPSGRSGIRQSPFRSMSVRSSPGLDQQDSTRYAGDSHDFNSNAPKNSALFGHHDPSASPQSVDLSIKSLPCKHCNGTGSSAGTDTPTLDRTGLSQPSLKPSRMYPAQDPRSPFTCSKDVSTHANLVAGRPSPASLLSEAHF